MPPITPAQARIVDPVLTTVARGYMHASHVWMELFPPVMVAVRGGHIVTFGTEDFAKLGIERAPGSNRAQINFGYQGDQFALVQRALDGKVPTEVMQDSLVTPGIDYGMMAVRKTMSAVSLQIEVAAADLATKTTSYDVDHRQVIAAADRWDAAGSLPAKAVEAKKEEIAEGIGLEPNVMIVGVPVHRALLNNPDVIDRIKHTEGLSGSSMPLVNEQKLAQYFGVERYRVGRARSRAKANAAFMPLWGKVAILAYSEVTALAAMGSPSFGYTYRLTGYPMAAPAYYDNACDSWLYPVTTEDTPVLAGKAGGFLFTTVVS